MKSFIRRLFCRHTKGLTFVRNIYGDEINHVGGKRSSWLCNHCGEHVYLADLHEVASQPVRQLICIDFKQATELLEMFGGEPADITLTLGDGHSGHGLYAHYTEMPDEGAHYLGVCDDDARPEASQPSALPACPMCEAHTAGECSGKGCGYMAPETSLPVEGERLDAVLSNAFHDYYHKVRADVGHDQWLRIGRFIAGRIMKGGAA